MNAQQKSLLIGALLGAVIGAVGGFLFSRGLEMPRENEGEKSKQLSLRSVPPGEIAKLGLGIMTVLRGIAELGERV
jgi:hypothetical protein